MSKGYIPDRGDIVWVQFTPQAGHGQAGHRPAVVVSPSAYNRSLGLCLVMSITGKAKGYPFEVPVPAGVAVSGVILADQIKSIDWKARGVQLKGRLDAETMLEATGKVLALIDPGGEFTTEEPAAGEWDGRIANGRLFGRDPRLDMGFHPNGG
ncbi:MAG: MazF [Gemmataceae bacterium]|nr:MazF [Gemmataceae bacterium]